MLLASCSAVFSQNKAYKNALNRASKIKDYEKALKYFDKAIAIDTLDYEGYYCRGYRHYNNGEYEKAILDFKKAQQLNPTDECSYRMGAQSRSELNDYEGAIKDYKSIFNWNP